MYDIHIESLTSPFMLNIRLPIRHHVTTFSRLTDPEVHLSKRIFGPKTRKQFDAPRQSTDAVIGVIGYDRCDRI